MIKFAHTSDWHLGKRQDNDPERFDDNFKAINHIILQALEQKVDFFLICGDIFDRPNPHPRTLYLAHHYLQLLQKAKIPVYIVRGNHDVSQRFISENTLEFFEKLGLFWILENEMNEFELEGMKIRLYGVGFVYDYMGNLYESIDSLIENSPIDKDYYNILLLHASVSGLVTSEGLASDARPARSDDDKMSGSALLLANYGFNYVALGHHHRTAWTRMKNSLIAYSGAPEHWNIRNWDGPGIPTTFKYWLLVEIEAGADYPTITEISFPVRPKIYYLQDYREMSPNETVQKIKTDFESLNEDLPEAVLRGRIYLSFNRLEEQNPFVDWKTWIPDLLQRSSFIDFVDHEVASELDDTTELTDFDIMDEYVEKNYPKQAEIWLSLIKQGLETLSDLDIQKYDVKDDKVDDMKVSMLKKLEEIKSDA
ncbi:MAG: exonuclease SbcCD subunit D [Candidatus Heimdallarchaeota archaeon]|nr:exonuclease SbcCD subunit D [Candidatus Heimdallarchaeota archaeon]